MRSSYFKLDDKQGFERFSDTELIYMDGDVCLCHVCVGCSAAIQANSAAQLRSTGAVLLHAGHITPSVLRCVPSEMAKAIYIPWEPGQLFHRQGYPNTSDFVTDLLEEVAGLTSIRGNLSPMVEVNVV